MYRSFVFTTRLSFGLAKLVSNQSNVVYIEIYSVIVKRHLASGL